MNAIKPSRSKDDYEKLREMASRPARQRERILRTPKGKLVAPRRYGMSPELLEAKLGQYKATGVFPNPQRRQGAYYGFVQALIELGVDKVHDFRVVKKKMQEVMTKMVLSGKYANAWEAFTIKKSRNALCAYDVNKKIMCNALLLQRICSAHTYGEPLRQMHACIDIFKGEQVGETWVPMYRLNTKFSAYELVEPVNEFCKKRKRRELEEEV